MKTYARIQDGVVAELISTDGDITEMFHPDLVWIDITAIGPAPQQGWHYDGHAFSAPPAPPEPTLAQQAAAMLATGCQIASSGTPALNATYPVDPNSRSNVQAVSLYIQINGRFPASKATISFPDATGAPRSFVSTAQYQAFATALGDFVATLDDIVLHGAGTLPAQPVTIT